MSRQENVSLQTRMDIERKEDLEPDGVTSYHVMLEQLASPTGEQQQKTVKYGRQLLIKRNLIEGSSSMDMYVLQTENIISIKILSVKIFQEKIK